MKQNKRVLVGMSGGIDSSATCLMLQEKGYEVIGLTMQVWGEAPDDAKALADRIGIKHYIIDERTPFKETIIKNFIDEYRSGRTPNPCVMCNPLFKFRILAEWADKLDCAWIATGHYSRLEERDGYIYIVAGEDEKKDQSYFLWRLSQDVLRRCMFPLATYTKPQVREYLREKGFEAKASEGESMEVCFIKGDYRNFLKEQYPEIDNEIGEGWFVNQEGVKLGYHKGYPYYTIGQRKGLEIALGKPAYVLKINPQKNTVMLGDADQLIAEYMLIEQPNIINEQEFFACNTLNVRIRYRSKPIPCSAYPLEDGRMLVHFKEEASAITPGQSAVFYDGRRVLGGAFIASQRGIGLIINEMTDKIKTNNTSL
ncbi:tRNA 2-thiouridine(34) synthase MnmA [Bacteroides sp. 519]|uniref:tRNA 2-thiouridine(34) synthase MnmA n=1 Tax=Bacteroides sp. 519 TaxID=2302937 RepID=UPI0013D2CFF1|nr:tRNA 2-thiouridine(34) synthase MnmA [Bacteroides sp. 519]NDV58770.1 tRNA 2-thiouridine(34) synthase MnmA [Bacteroides sp. 519]